MSILMSEVSTWMRLALKKHDTGLARALCRYPQPVPAKQNLVLVVSPEEYVMSLCCIVVLLYLWWSHGGGV